LNLINNKHINFIYFSNSNDASGIILKVNNFRKSSESLGHATSILKLNVENGFINNFKLLVNKVCKSEGIFFFRYNNSLNVFFFIAICILRLRNQIVITEIPTPITNYLNELFMSKSSFLKKLVIFFNTLFLGPLPFILSNLNIQYSLESKFFSLLSKSILIGNGIDTDYYILKKNYNKNKYLKFIIIANLAPWHGVDKILIALSKINYNFELKIVGDGVEYEKLQLLSNKLNLENSVLFLGNMNRKEYVKYLYSSDLGIGSMSWDLIGVKVSSALKLREYVSCGLPVVFTSFDPDLSDQEFAFQVDGSQNSIDQFFSTLPFLDNSISSDKIRSFAKNKLSMKEKMKSILNEINIG